MHRALGLAFPLLACWWQAPGEEREAAAPIAWPEATPESRPGLYWWIPGSAMDEENLSWNLEVLAEAGFGGVGMVLIYGVKGEEESFLDFLSPRWVEMFDHAAREAERLGLWLDLTPGGGWRLGGPEIGEARGEQRISFEGGRLVPVPVDTRVKRAGPGATGRAINPYSKRVLLEYLGKFDAVLDREGGPVPRAFYHDSFEYRGNWCPELPAAFAARRGYELDERIEALAGRGDPEISARVRCDYRQTLNELHLECVEALADWAGRRGASVRQQAHGSPTNLLDAYALCGIPETESFGANAFAIPGLRREPSNVRAERPEPLLSRLASSAAHLAGRKLVAAETCTWVRNHFRTALSQVKPEVDLLLLAGVNHVLLHGCCYSPRDAEWPGWLFYASLQCNPRNAFWRDVPALTEYVTRCQSVLQAGEPDGDVLLYWPIWDLWSSGADPLERRLAVHSPGWLMDSACGRAARQLVERGHSFDLVSDRLLAPVRCEEGRLRVHGASWSAILVPDATHMPAATLEKLVELAESGARILFQGGLPGDVPGLGRLEERRVAFARARARLSSLGDARVAIGEDLDALLAGVAPEPMVALGLDCVRRRDGEGTSYFVANQGARTVDGWIPLARPAAAVAVLDPMTGRAGLASLRTREGRPEVRLEIRPGESLILKALARAPTGAPPWPVWAPAGEALTVEGEWRVEFVQGGPVLPRSFTTAELGSWTDAEDPEAERFAGTARYRVEIELPPDAAARWRLDLGDVRESARVSANGRRAGTLIAHPFALDLDGLMRPGRNLLEIEVTNLSANRIRDLDRRSVGWKRFHDINFVDHEYRPFDASDWPTSPSGLLGPVRLTPMREALEPGGG